MQWLLKNVAVFVDWRLSSIANYAIKFFMRLEQYLVSTGQSATAFAKKAGVSPSSITRIINQDVRQPHFNTQRKIIAASDNMVSYDDLWPVMHIDEDAL